MSNSPRLDLKVTDPFPFESLPRVWRWIEPFREKVADDFAPQDMESFLSFMGGKWEQMRSWAVYGDGELGGLILFERLSKWLGTAHILLKPDFHGRGLAVKACRSAFAEMFQEPGIGKLEFRVLAGNLAVGSLACNLGGKREGTLIGHTLSGGKPRDVWLYGLSKEEFARSAGTLPEGEPNVISIR
jgi:RimJ/RimL family protein N-acetyltransferase